MAQLYSTGPAFLWAGVGGGGYPGNVVFVGTDEDAPSIDVEPVFQAVKNDIGGDDAMDDSYQGRSATITYVINRLDEAVQAALAQTNPYSNTQRGTDDPGDVGSLMVTEGKAFPLWVVFPYAVGSPIPAIAKAAMAGMPAGYHFLACTLTRETHERLGTKNKRVPMTFRARRIYKAFSNNSQAGLVGAGASVFAGNVNPVIPPPAGAAPGSMSLYNHDMSAVTRLPT